MKRVLVYAILSACSATPIPYEVAPSNGIVFNDLGGVVWDRAQIIKAMNDDGRELEVRGEVCASACVMYLSLKSVCVQPGLTFQLHGLKDLTGRKIPDPDTLALVEAIYLQHLPDWIGDRWAREVRGLPAKFFSIPAADVVSSGSAKYCTQ